LADNGDGDDDVGLDSAAAPPGSRRRHEIVLDAGSGSRLLRVLEIAYDTAYVDTTQVPFVERSASNKYTWALDMRSSLTRADILRPVADAIVADVLNPRGIDQIVGYGFGAFPLLGAVAAVRGGVSFGMLRFAAKPDGFCKLIEGSLDAASPVLVVDDLVNSGKSLKKTVGTMRSLGYQIAAATCVFQFDWGEARRNAGQMGIEVLPLAMLRNRPR
jgi:orotate phosphoribosyltransferase